jgi:Protein of unknown function (DUF3306)
MSDATGFLSRWSRRKAQARHGVALPAPALPESASEPAVAPAAPAAAVPAPQAQSVVVAIPTSEASGSSEPPAPTMADVAALTRESNFSRFVAPGVDGEVKNAALKKLFDDPHFNAMDGLDVYIDDYGKPDPLPLSSLRQMAQAAFLGLVDPEPPAAAAPASARSPAESPTCAAVDATTADGSATPQSDEDTDLRLQPHDAAGCGGAEDGAAAHGPGQL